ncbi:MAG: radical SAM protein [Bacillati bacterium ANGP1]|uniref:Radical SAM protein n=1 Tax=Candidatus Segetimicrobium genomatis TaxID=2569760 RepID=A0A537IRE6_9BACT|nr:MAG: radical SAM protein [Terrabacteria group bacterium ANGP1]
MEHRSITTVQEKEFGHELMTKLDGRRFPVSGQWELTCRCNLRCVMCYTDCFNTPDRLREELSFHEIVRIMDEIQEAGCLEITLTGGEPLARKGFFGHLRLCEAERLLDHSVHQRDDGHRTPRRVLDAVSARDDRDQLPWPDQAVF